MDKARFDTRLAKDQKELFEHAAQLGGFRTLTDFVIHALLEKSKAIIAEHNAILVTRRDQQIFFEALLRDEEPNEALKAAAAQYKKAVDDK